MFASRAESCLPSFSELLLSIQHQPYQSSYYHYDQGYTPMPLPLRPLYNPHGDILRSNTMTPYSRSEYDLVASSPILNISKSPLGSVRLLDLSRMTPENPLPVPPAFNTMSSSSSVSSVNSTPSSSVVAPSPPVSGSSEAPKRKHACTVCGRCFTTLGHLARHNRTHTGERKHVCPFPSCEARFARQDNCMQHYKTHINGKGRRSRARNASPVLKPADKLAETVWYAKV